MGSTDGDSADERNPARRQVRLPQSMGSRPVPGPVSACLLRLRCAAPSARTRVAFTAFQDLLADFLSGSLDFLHFLADAGAGGLVPANRLGDVVIRFLYQTLQRVVFLHGGYSSQKGSGQAKNTIRTPMACQFAGFGGSEGATRMGGHQCRLRL